MMRELTHEGLATAPQVCRVWRDVIASDDRLWQHHYGKHNWPHPFYNKQQLYTSWKDAYIHQTGRSCYDCLTWTQRTTLGFAPLKLRFCQKCRQGYESSNPTQRLLSASEAQYRFRLKAAHLQEVPHALDANPINPQFDAMRLYRRPDVFRRAVEVHGSVDAVCAQMRRRLDDPSSRHNLERSSRKEARRRSDLTNLQAVKVRDRQTDSNWHLRQQNEQPQARQQEPRPTAIQAAVERLGGKFARVVIKRGKANVFKAGHPLVYSGAIDRVVGRAPAAGDVVVVTDGADTAIAWGVYNPVSMFRVRIMQVESEVARDPTFALDLLGLVKHRIGQAKDLRRALGLVGSSDAYRLVNSEGDRLSGIIVEYLRGSLVVASSAAWVERYRAEITHALEAATQSRVSRWQAAVDMLKEEGVEQSSSDGESEASASDTEAEEMHALAEGGVHFLMSGKGQKTGFYADQRESRQLIRSLAKGKRVLDLCCYTGGFAMCAAVGGASHVTGVDSSAKAISLAQAAAYREDLNALKPEACQFVQADIVAFMQQAKADGQQWDIVVLDPPKLAPNRKALRRATTHYRKLNTLAMQLTQPGGLLMTCSCSGAMTQSGEFVPMLQAAAAQAGRAITLLRSAGAASDHTLDPAFPEGHYLTNVLLRVL
ncbi:hypothetical protein WJX72_001460 [[Myrmecia] bisecta]|uniref:PUA domain-containing protein n=1 Tax=[Myrmecia] bisecta TaxID=41462 RepID=A0AAW1Q123_9CHLO